ncbi:MAG: NAD(P)-binding domain-containing protein, partial [Burkholderiales bacterium]
MKLGFIGLGVMGQAMVANLMRGGHEMNVFARKPETLEGLISAGAV